MAQGRRLEKSHLVTSATVVEAGDEASQLGWELAAASLVLLAGLGSRLVWRLTSPDGFD